MRLAFVLAAALTSSAQAGPADAVINGLTGHFDNSAQRAALPDDIAAAPKPGSPWLVQLTARAAEVAIPALPGRAVYLEWRKPDGTLDRQRIWSFQQRDDGSVLMLFYTFKDPKPFDGALDDPARLKAVTSEMLVTYPEGCAAIFAAGSTTGVMAPGTCRIVAQQSKRVMFLEAEIALTDTGFTYREAGVLEDGSDAFRVPGVAQIEFKRVP